jgi:MoxR-like ATPase
LRFRAEQAVVVAVPTSVAETGRLLGEQAYLADHGLTVAVFLSLTLGRPLLIEGEAGVGKTEIAKALAGGLGRKLIRLQCHEGLDVASAAYEWNHLRQMLELRLAEAAGEPRSREALTAELFTTRFLLKRPLLQALESYPEGAPVLLIDEIDRADAPFEAFLLEILSEFQITVPELGTLRAGVPPIVILTSNRTREIHDALKRRCLYHWLNYPDAERETEILLRRAPAVNEQLARQIVAYVQELRGRGLFKPPGIAETIDWAHAILALGRHALDDALLADTLGVLLKYEEDLAAVRRGLSDDLSAVPAKPKSWSR